MGRIYRFLFLALFIFAVYVSYRNVELTDKVNKYEEVVTTDNDFIKSLQDLSDNSASYSALLKDVIEAQTINNKSEVNRIVDLVNKKQEKIDVIIEEVDSLTNEREEKMKKVGYITIYK